MLRLWIKPHPSRPGVFIAALEGKTLCVSRQPMADGCRMLIKMGFPPTMPATMRHHDASADSCRPETLQAWASRSVVEGRTIPYVAFSAARVHHTGDSSGSGQEDCTPPDPFREALQGYQPKSPRRSVVWDPKERK